MSENKSTHVVFNGKSIEVSLDVWNIFNFLIEIDKESQAIFNTEETLKSVREYYLDLLQYTQELRQKLKDNNLECDYQFKFNPIKFSELLKYQTPIRSQMIVLFTQLEVLFFLYIAYEKEIDSDDELREIAMKDKKLRKDFISQFILSQDNEYFKQHRNRFKKLDAGKIVRLRNTLVHFFSLPSDSIGVYHEQLRGNALKLEKNAATNKNGGLVMISPIDMYELIKSAYELTLRNWTESTYKNNDDFKRKIWFVNSLVTKHGAVAARF